MASGTTDTRALVSRYLDPTARWSGADDRRLRELCRDDAEAAAVYNRAVVRHRLLAGGDPAVPSGFELRRLAAASADLAHLPGGATRASTTRWLAWLAPAAALAVALIVVPFASSSGDVDPDDYIGARGLEPSWPSPRAGLGVGAVTAEGDEYEAVYAPAHLDDWLRLSYTNEHSDLRWLFVLAIQPERADPIVWIAPTPDEARSLPITFARFAQLPFEVRIAARHALGPVRFVALFTAEPLALDTVRSQLLASSLVDALPSELEARLRDRLQLSPRDVVQVVETRIVPGSAAGPSIDGRAPPGKEATPP